MENFVHSARRKDQPLPFYYVMVVWGEEYVGMLVDLALPSFLSPRNLPALSNLEESRFLILTTPEDRSRIERAPIFQALRSVIEVEFVESPWIKGSMPYYLKAAHGHRVGAEIAARNNGYCVYLCPDCLVSDGSFAYLERQARSGKQAVLTPGLRLVKETVYEELVGTGRVGAGSPLTFSGRELVAFGLRHLHREVQRYNWNDPCFTPHPHMCTWEVPGEAGLLIRAFHLHPMLVSLRDARDFSSLELSTIDGEFLGGHVADWDQIHVSTDSDDLLIFSLTGGNERAAFEEHNTASVEKIREMAYAPSVNPLHRLFFTKAVKLHAGEVGAAWSDLERSTAQLVYPILRFAPEDPGFLRNVPARRLARELVARVRRRGRIMVHNIWPFGKD